MSGLDGDDLRFRPFGHESLRGRGDDAVVRPEHAPGRDRRPGRTARGLATRAESDGALGGVEELSLSGGHAVGEGRQKDLLLQVEVHIAGRGAGVGHEVEDRGGVCCEGGVGAGERKDGFSFGGGERVDVDQRLDVAIPERALRPRAAPVRPKPLRYRRWRRSGAFTGQNYDI